MLAELQTRSGRAEKTITDTEATCAALGQSDAEQLKIEHRIELAEGLTATCATLLQDLDKASQGQRRRKSSMPTPKPRLLWMS